MTDRHTFRGSLVLGYIIGRLVVDGRLTDEQATYLTELSDGFDYPDNLDPVMQQIYEYLSRAGLLESEYVPDDDIPF